MTKASHTTRTFNDIGKVGEECGWHLSPPGKDDARLTRADAWPAHPATSLGPHPFSLTLVCPLGSRITWTLPSVDPCCSPLQAKSTCS